MRKLLLVGDPPSTGGAAQPHGIPYVGGVGGIDHAIIGGTVFCTACNSIGLIAKAGGPSRCKGNHREIALEGDILLCRCHVHPVMLSNSGLSWHPKHDDQIESLGAHSSRDRQRDSVSAATADKLFNDRFVLRGPDHQPIPNAAYAVERSSGAVEYGETDGAGHTHLLSSVASSENVDVYLAG
ncbi:PAAR domain-containing protein [Paraherbaspirillum soli]|uniref:PAAR domain-containing protein n=1 Tax=Paraherbaspirillum soli TaxID=631222 RepID=A0ABW0MGH3_9BURK